MDEVKAFLDSIERNSSQTRRTYNHGLTCFQDFLDSRSLTLETILQPLIKNQIDLYALLDKVCVLVTVKPEVNLKFKSNFKVKVKVIDVRQYYNGLSYCGQIIFRVS
jgi:hypothetical protein